VSAGTIRPLVPLEACLSAYASEEVVEDFYSSATDKRGTASKNIRFATFPKYMLVQLKRYYVSDDWTPKKIEASVPMPETLNLESLRGTGLRPGEIALPDKDEQPRAAQAAAEPAAPNEEIVASLVLMGFSEIGSRKAALATGNTSTELSMEWVFAHMHEPDFNDPPVAAAATSAASPAVSAEAIEMLCGMGFAPAHATAALSQCAGTLSLPFLLDRCYPFLFFWIGDVERFTDF